MPRATTADRRNQGTVYEAFQLTTLHAACCLLSPLPKSMQLISTAHLHKGRSKINKHLQDRRVGTGQLSAVSNWSITAATCQDLDTSNPGYNRCGTPPLSQTQHSTIDRSSHSATAASVMLCWATPAQLHCSQMSCTSVWLHPRHPAPTCYLAQVKPNWREPNTITLQASSASSDHMRWPCRKNIA